MTRSTEKHKDIWDLLEQLPKVELHRHLEGSLRISTLSDIATEHDLDLPGRHPEELRPHVQMMDDPPDFLRFLGKFRLLRHFYTNEETIKRLAYECVEDAAQDNVKYMELRFNPVAVSKSQGYTYEQVIEWVIEAVRQAEANHDILVRVIAQIGRDESLDVADRIAGAATSFQSEGVVGLDLAGDEINYPASRFSDIFRRARQAGMHITIHAGEAGPASNIREAIEIMGAERIGHGVRAQEDPDVLRLLIGSGTALEMCPTSNFQTGAVAHADQHPLAQYQQEGIHTTVNTDDPSISNITLTHEYVRVLEDIGVTPAALREMILTAVDAAFLPDEERRRLKARFEAALPNPLLPDGFFAGE